MRHDHTDWLIHFVRDRFPEQDFPGEDEDEVNFYAGGELEWDAPAFSVLKTIIRLGGLKPGFSFRSGRTTIYGGNPAICATEMPIYSFSKYVRDKNSSEKVSAYGIAFLKSEFYKAGGRPVIYGLSTENVNYEINSSRMRIINQNILPKKEQYRYVAYNPSGQKWLDWSHEREWRWVVQDKNRDSICCQDGDGIYEESPGLPIFIGQENGGFFSKACVIVWNENEAKEIQELLTGFYFAESNNYGTPFSKKLIEASSIIILDKVVSAVENGLDLASQTIEGLKREDLCEPIVIAKIPQGTAEKVNAALEKAISAGSSAAKKYLKSHKIEGGSCGFAHASTYEITNPIVQYMLNNDLASGPYDGKVWVNINGNWPFSQSIDYKEYIYEAVCECLTGELGIPFYVDSRLD